MKEFHFWNCPSYLEYVLVSRYLKGILIVFDISPKVSMLLCTLNKLLTELFVFHFERSAFTKLSRENNRSTASFIIAKIIFKDKFLSNL